VRRQSELAIGFLVASALWSVVGLFISIKPAESGIPVTAGMMGVVHADAWIGFWGSIVAAVLAVIATGAGAVLAWIAIRRQVRIGLLAREEERMERQIPSIRRAEQILSSLIEKIRSSDEDDLKSIFSDQFGVDLRTKKRLPTLTSRLAEAESDTGYQLRQLFFNLQRGFKSMSAAKTHSREARTNFGLNEGSDWEAEYREASERADDEMDLAVQRYHSAFTEMEVIANKLAQRVQLYEMRLPKFRDEIERYFG
jgi:hypothetical protein